MAALALAVRQDAGTEFSMAVFDDKEAIDLLGQLNETLLRAGWKEIDWTGGGDVVLSRGPGHARVGIQAVEGLYVQADIEQRKRFEPIVHRLGQALIKAGLAIKGEIGKLPDGENKNAIRILVGEKPR